MTQQQRSLIGAQNAIGLGLLLACLQAADGFLTMLGVDRYGVAVEGNPILRGMMLQIGHVPSLTLVKGIAILFIIALTAYARTQVWIRHAMGAVSVIYLFAAIIPWTYILFIRPGM